MVQVTGSHLESDADVSFFDDGACPGFGCRIEVVGEEEWHIATAWVTTIVSEVAFAGDEFGVVVTIEIGEGHGMGLGEAFVDEDFVEGEGVWFGVWCLAPPVKAVIVTLAYEDIGETIGIDIVNEHGDAGRELPIGVEFPSLFPGFAIGMFVPAGAGQEICASITVEIACTETVGIPGFGDASANEGSGVGEGVWFLDFPDEEWVLVVPAIDDELGELIAIEILEEFGFIFAELGIDPIVGWPELTESEGFGARIFKPLDFGLDEGDGEDIESAVAVDVVEEIAVAVGVAVPIVDGAEGAGDEIGGWVPVSAGDHIERAIAIDIADGAPFIGIEGEWFDFPGLG